MIKNFETVKAQLADLAGIINSFKSEAVQLRIIELVLGGSKANEEEKELDEETTGQKKGSRQRRNKRPIKGAKDGSKKPGKSSGGTGAVATLMRIAETDFFAKPRTINDIIDQCKNKYARHFKANEFSGKLGRMVRESELTRQKNKDKQYEYKKP